MNSQVQDHFEIDSLESLAIEGRSGRAFGLLIRAYRHAADSSGDPWQFAISIDELRGIGLHDIDLCWLLNKRYAEHGVETTIPGDQRRSFRTLPTRIVCPHTFYTLAKEGFAALSRLGQSSGHAPPGHPQKETEAVTEEHSSNGAAPAIATLVHRPVWDGEQRELRFCGQIIKRFRVPAANQERILAAFEEESWPPGIDDPLSPEGEQDPIRRLQATIKSLNRNQTNPLVRFRGNGNGDRICWDMVEVV
jgi:hypothetical protein